jgi:hypothetical protein
MVFRLALELHKDVEDILAWRPEKFAMWVSFLKIRQDELKKETAKSRTKSRSRPRKG